MIVKAVVNIRKATVADANGIANVQVLGWRMAYDGIIDADYLLNQLNEKTQVAEWKTRLAANAQFSSRQPQPTVWVAVQHGATHEDINEDDRVVGFCAAGPPRTIPKLKSNLNKEDCNNSLIDLSKTGELYAIYVLKEFQNYGIGLRLVDHAKSYLREVGYKRLIVWALSENKKAIQFYQNQGGTFLLEEDHPTGDHEYPESCFLFKNI